jgi:hypothetical protein
VQGAAVAFSVAVNVPTLVSMVTGTGPSKVVVALGGFTGFAGVPDLAQAHVVLPACGAVLEELPQAARVGSRASVAAAAASLVSTASMVEGRR